MLSKVQLIILYSALECTKNNMLWPLAKKGCVPLMCIILSTNTCT